MSGNRVDNQPRPVIKPTPGIEKIRVDDDKPLLAPVTDTWGEAAITNPANARKEPPLPRATSTGSAAGTAELYSKDGVPTPDTKNAGNDVVAGDWKPPPHVRSYQMGPGFDQVRSGAEIARGQMGPDVERLQGKLNAAFKGMGMDPLERDGLFGPKTEAALRTYQESRGLPATGKLDAATLKALESNKPATAGWTPPAPSAQPGGPGGANPGASGVTSGPTVGMTEEQKFNHYKALIEKSGGRFNPNGPNIVGVRSETNTNENRGGGRYDDTMAVIWQDRSGRMHVREFNGNTEPSARYRGSMGQDVNGDGRLDQGRLRTGHYEFQVSTFKGRPALRMVGDSIVDRDANQDGVFGNDRGASSRGGASMLFHVGGSSITGSAGCQTLPPGEFDSFMSALREAGGNGRIGYTLVNR